MPAFQRTSLAIPWSLLAVLFLASQTHGADHPAWWADALVEAARDGYSLVDDHELETLRADSRVRIMDVRPDYEFDMGHVPGAVNMEFDLGDERELSTERVRRLAELLGPDRGRTVVFYCRSFM